MINISECIARGGQTCAESDVALAKKTMEHQYERLTIKVTFLKNKSLRITNVKSQ